MKNILICGYFYNWNFGDTVLVRTLRAHLGRRYPDANFSILKGDETLQRLLGASVLEYPDLARGRFDAVYFTGGGYAGDNGFPLYTRKGLRFVFDYTTLIVLPAVIARLFERPVYVCGVGGHKMAGVTPRMLRHCFLTACTKVYIRDSPSFAYLSAKYPRVRKGGDMAVLAHESPPYEHHAAAVLPGATKTVGIHLYSDRGFAFLKSILLVLLGVLKTRSESYRLVVISDNRKSFPWNEALRDLAAQQGFDVECKEFVGNDGDVAELQGFDYVVTSKLHVGVVASAGGAWVLPLLGHEKIRDYYAEVEYPIAPIPMDEGRIADHFGSLLDRSRDESWSVPASYRAEVLNMVEDVTT